MSTIPEVPDSQIQEKSRQHSFWSWSAQDAVDPIPVVRAEGVYFWDSDGKRYLDLNSMLMCSNIGHGDKRVTEAIAAQARELAFAAPSMATRPRAQLGLMLAEIMPEGLDRFFYTLGGADANENAIKLARAHTGRHKILARYRSYHGATHGAIAATGDPRRWAWEPAVMPGVVHFLDPYRYRSTFHARGDEPAEAEFAQDYLDHLEEIIQYEGPETIAAVMIETVTGTNGIIIPPEGYLPGVRALCDRYGILLICDEVMSGFGRTGAWFAVNHWGVVPDLMTMAKGLTSAYAPLGAVAMKAEIADTFGDRVFQGGLTYSGHPISLAAAVANLSVMHEDRLVERAAETGKSLAGHLRQMGEAHPCVGDVRSIGLFGVLELVKDRKTREPMAPFNGTSPEMQALRAELLRLGVYAFVHWNNLMVVPPLTITEEQLAEGFAAVDQALEGPDRAARA
ncbi:MAG TPA: aminotransferase class III-fold pyridoxal phosphate-dependent enzyme [Anaerolineales bacterium]|nr:aminotransferase class III-fold pyridoxal phosphate-dependent enzyme [Anaerolineales bacterium]